MFFFLFHPCLEIFWNGSRMMFCVQNIAYISGRRSPIRRIAGLKPANPLSQYIAVMSPWHAGSPSLYPTSPLDIHSIPITNTSIYTPLYIIYIYIYMCQVWLAGYPNPHVCWLYPPAKQHRHRNLHIYFDDLPIENGGLPAIIVLNYHNVIIEAYNAQMLKCVFGQSLHVCCCC